MNEPGLRRRRIRADFTSALILGLDHPSRSLSWDTLTTGKPAALRGGERAFDPVAALAREVATLTSQPQALLFSSTLHALGDLFGCLWRAPSVIVFDDAIYPITRWSLDRAAVKGARLLPFRHLDPLALRSALQHAAPHRAPPWLITDGICAGCGRPAPLGDYLEALRPLGGSLIIDDAQAMGLYGCEVIGAAPYGEGGGGSLARAGLAGAPDAIVVASMAKAFGAPLAFMAGAAPFIEMARGACETLFHCSPPCGPVVRAARAALAANAHGDLARRRRRLAQRVRTFREAIEERGLVVRGGSFPMQRVPLPDLTTALAVQRRMLVRGVRAVVRHVRCIDEVSVTFVVTALHDDEQLGLAAQALAAACAPGRSARSSAFLAPSSSSSRRSGAAFPSSNVEA